MNVVQSYLTTVMRGNFSVLEIRIFVNIVAHANKILRGVKVSKLIGSSVCTDGLNCNLSIPVRSVMPETSHDYMQVKAALKNLAKKQVEFYDAEKKTWFCTPFISNIRVGEHDGLIKFTCARWLLDYILNFVYGNFSLYNLEAALSLTSAYAVRLYWLTCSMRDPLRFSISMLRDMLGVGDKYKQTKDFIKRCIDPAEKMLAAHKLNGFSYKKGIVKGRVQYIQFIPVKREEPTDNQLLAQVNGSSTWIDPVLRQYLTAQAGFTMRELSSHKKLWLNLIKMPEWQEKVVQIVNRARRKGAGKGYIIKGLQDSLTDNPSKALATRVLDQWKQRGQVMNKT